MNNVTLLQVDNFVEEAKTFSSSEDYLNQLSNLIFLYFEIVDGSSKATQEFLFGRQLENNKKRFISICLLRVYSINPEIILSNTFIKHKVHNLISESTPDVFNYLKISDKDETFVKESNLSSIIKSLEYQVHQTLNVEIDLHDINQFGNAYRSVLKGGIIKSVFNAFIDDNSIWQQIDSCFKIVKEYEESDTVNKYSILEASLKKIDGLIERASDIGTKYCFEYIVKPFSNIKKAIISDFEGNPQSKPAKLTVECSDKKYPFLKNVNHTIQLKLINESSGHAFDTIIKIKLYSDDIIKLNRTEQYVGQIEVSSVINFDYQGIDNSDSIMLFGEIEWVNFNKEKSKFEFEILLEGQISTINWDELQSKEPYDLEPVTEQNDFIGRKSIINSLKTIKKKVSSSYIFGQRRVGKTSIVKTLQNIIDVNHLFTIYIEAGDWGNATSPHVSMEDLGNIICNRIRNYSNKFSNVETPKFDGSLNRITDFLDKITTIDPEFRVLIILDEFDRVPSQLLNPNDISQSFVLTLRSISNRDNFGFILVGGEKLEYLLSQWQEFNKFRPIRVDYFDKKAEWEDFRNLIKFPVENILEISDQAIDYIYSQTSGNPYFTKKVCIELFAYMVSKRDCHVTEVEAKKATQLARYKDSTSATDFSHFWKDGIKEKAEIEDVISINRKKVLLAFGQLLKSGKSTTKQNIIDQANRRGLHEFIAEKTLEEFVQRKILEVNLNEYKLIVKFFEDWLISDGMELLLTTFKEEESLHLRQLYEDEIKVKHDELNMLSQSWSTYKGKQISTDLIRQWLDQFNNIEEQRCAFTILQNIKFFTQLEIREHLQTLYVEVNKAIRNIDINYVSKKSQDRKISGILVSYLDDNPSKSGAEYAKIFIEANNIYKQNCDEKSKISNRLNGGEIIKAIVFVDDMLGSGKSCIENFDQFYNDNISVLNEKKPMIVFGFITGYLEAKYKVEKAFSKIPLDYKIILVVPLDEPDKCFSRNNKIFKKTIDRQNAEIVCKKVGMELELKNPLGYGDCQATIVFPNTCPNNSLPILWKETKNWKPLFKRS